VQIGAELLCKGGKVNDVEKITEDVSCEDRAKVQIGAELLCKGGKVNDKIGRGVAEAGKITEYRV
jgi:uncharacterized protein (DUF1330 family)